MENKGLKILRVGHLILMVAALVACIYSLILDMTTVYEFDKQILLYIVGLIKLLPNIVLLFGLIYFIEGYKKNASSFYKIYMFLFAVEFIAQLVGYLVSGAFEPFRLILTAISLLSIIALFAVKNLGKNKSLIIVLVFIVARALMLIIYPTAVWEGGKLAEIIRGLTDVMLAVSAGLMVTGKYIDKTQRGTK